MKKRIKLLWAHFWFDSELLSVYWWLRYKIVGPYQTVILMYHRVVPQGRKDRIYSPLGYIVYQDTFEKQILFLKQHYHILSLDEFLRTRTNGEILPPKSIIITFDDGWEDNYLYAFPILKQNNVPATIFLCSNFVNTRKLFWPEKIIFLIRSLHQIPHHQGEIISVLQPITLRHTIYTLMGNIEDRNAWETLIQSVKILSKEEREKFIVSLETELGQPIYPAADNSCLTWDQVQEMMRHGITFGSHTANHCILTQVTEDRMRSELKDSKEKLEEKLGVPIETFAYPNGSHNNQAVQCVKDAGYVAALTTEPGFNKAQTDPYRLRRINVQEWRSTNSNGRFSRSFFSAYISRIL